MERNWAQSSLPVASSSLAPVEERNQNNLIVDNWVLVPLRKEGLVPMSIGLRLRQRLRRDFALVEKASTAADSTGRLALSIPWVITGLILGRLIDSVVISETSPVRLRVSF